MESLQENILLPDFYNYLEVVIYNGPPNTIWGKYYGRVISGNELSILAALKACYSSDALFRNIVNPSDNVILYYLSDSCIHLLKNTKLNPSKILIKQAILINGENFKDFKSLFDQKEILEIIENNLDRNPGCYIYRDVDDLTLEMCKLIVSQSKYMYSDLLKYIKHWDTELINMIINHKSITSNLEIIPNLSLDQINEAILINPRRLKCFTNIIFDKDIYINLYDKDPECIEFIPYEFQTDHMHSDIRSKHLQFVIFLRDRNQDDFNRLFDRYIGNIRLIPKEFQTLQMTKDCIDYDKYLLKHCYCIDNDILTLIFKSTKNRNVPKKDRFDFIRNFEEDALIRITKIKPSLLKVLSENKQTDRLIKEILQFNGYALQDVINPTKEHIDIALLQEPKAIKYVKTF